MPNINNCVPYRAGTCSSFVSSENGCKHEAKNPDKKAIRQFKVDGGYFDLVLLYQEYIRTDVIKHKEVKFYKVIGE